MNHTELRAQGIDVPVPGKRRMSSSDYLHSDPKSKMLIETQAAVEESLASLLGINDSNLLVRPEAICIRI